MKLSAFLLLFMAPIALWAHAVQVGDAYSKKSYSDLYGKNQSIDGIIENTVLINSERGALVNRGSGFYIGKHKGKHLFVTNAHVMNERECKNAEVSFLTEDFKVRSVSCESVLFSRYKNDYQDITVFTLADYNVGNMLGGGLEIDWDFTPRSGQALAFAGFGMKTPPLTSNIKLHNRKMKRFGMNISQDSDCVVSSKDNTLFIIDSIRARNIFATGCDSASGDSGSAIIDLQSGKVIGLLFSSTDNGLRISSDEFSSLIGSNSKAIWSAGTFAFSFARMRDLFSIYGL